MREILFKAKIKNWRELPKEKQWVEGYLMDENYINTPFNDYDAHGRFDDPIEIDPDTICQYTGLVDKNDKKIWKNDIVRWRFRRPWKEEYHVSKVLWDDFYSGWKLTVPGGMAKMRKDIEYEVIGNIFDNLEVE